MDIYHFHPQTGEIVGKGKADPDPLKKGSYLIPAHATKLAPPAAGANEAAVYADGQWQLVADYRGTEYWLNDGSHHEISDLGVEPPTDALDSPPPQPIADLAADQRTAIENGRKAAEADGVTVSGIRYAGDPGNRAALREAIDFAETQGLTTFASWKDSDDVFHADHPVADVRQALNDIAARRSQLIAREGELVAQIDTAEQNGDRAGIEAVTWSLPA